MDKYKDKYCKYCTKAIFIIHAESIVCIKCNLHIHLLCLKRKCTPGGLEGDTFFKFTCQECSQTNLEVFEREKLTWFQVIVLIMYHLQNKLFGLANKGFYHWKIHLVTFIDKKWDVLFTKEFKRKKNWTGTVSGTLSHFSPCFFTSGLKFLGSSGWWKLTFPDLTPTYVMTIYTELTVDKKINLRNEGDLVHIKNFINKYPQIFECNFKGLSFSTEIENFIPDEILDGEDDQFSTELTIDPKNRLKYHYDINQVCENFLPTRSEEESSELTTTETSLGFKKKEKTFFYEYWNKNIKKPSCSKKTIKNIYPLRNIEEQALLFHLKKTKMKSQPKRLKRKLEVRAIKKEKCIRTLNIDDKHIPLMQSLYDEKDRFCLYYNKEQLHNSNEFYYVEKRMITGRINRTYISSPYTKRILKPFIRRDKNYKSLWLNLMHELLYTVKMKSSDCIEPKISTIDCVEPKISTIDCIEPKISTIDYSYVRPEFIPCINNICENFFWPGIDMTETLTYPDFTCVVLYKKLVIGFAFMVPDVNFNETYISFLFVRPEWRRAGIGKFMIYHLTQTCLGKDITLHVAIDNPAIFLYQQFGFKVEEVVYNFYDAYLRDDSKTSKHAFFLRLER